MDGEDSKQRLNLQTLNCECLSFELTMCLLFNYESSELNLVSYLFFVPQNTDNNLFFLIFVEHNQNCKEYFENSLKQMLQI